MKKRMAGVGDFFTRYPDKQFVFVTEMGYVGLMHYAQAIEKAGSTDPDAVASVLDDPNWTFDRLGVQTKMGGLQTFGIARQLPLTLYYGEIHDGKVETKGAILTEVP
jgi:hypothetical protein